MADFSLYPACVDALREGNQEKISQATTLIKETYERTKGFCEYLIGFFEGAGGRNDVFGVAFGLTNMKNFIAKFWEVEDLFEDKERVRSTLLQLLSTPLMNAQNVLNLVVTMIGIIANNDYPTKWRSLMPFLTGAIDKSVEAGNGAMIMIILDAVYEVFKKYERSSSETVMKELNISLDYWDQRVVNLLTEVLKLLSDMDNDIRQIYTNALSSMINGELNQYFNRFKRIWYF